MAFYIIFENKIYAVSTADPKKSRNYKNILKSARCIKKYMKN